MSWKLFHNVNSIKVAATTSGDGCWYSVARTAVTLQLIQMLSCLSRSKQLNPTS